MKRSIPVRTALTAFLALVTAAAFSACSPKAKLDRHVANAERFMEAGQYEAAEIELLNAQRIDPRHGAALAVLGSLYFDQGSLTKSVPRLRAARELAPTMLDARLRLGRAYLTLGRPEEARAEAVAVLEQRPDDAEAIPLLAESSTSPELIADARNRLTTSTSAASHVGLAMLDLREKNVSGAADHISRALASDPKSGQAHAVKASLHLVQNEPDEAVSALRTAVELSPVRSNLRLALARVYAARNNLAEARQTLETTLQAAPDYAPAAIMLAELASGTGAHEEAAKLLDGVLTRDPDNPEAALLRARVHLAVGENTAAIARLEKLTTTFAESVPMHFMLARAYTATNEVNKAQASLARVLQLAPDHAEAMLMRAAFQVRAGDAGGAISPLRELVKKHPESVRARILLADALRARGQAEDALQIYREAIEAAPQDPQLRLFLGGLHLQLGRTAEARQAFEQGLRIKPDFTACVEQLVALDLAAKDVAAAERRAAEFAEKYPTQPEAHVLVAKVALAQGNTARAESALNKAIEVSPESAAPYMLLGQLFLSERRQDEALANLRTATEKNPRDVAAYMLMGILLHQKGELQASRAAYEKLLQVNPNFVPALNNLAYLCSENFGELDRAYELANRARELRPNDPVALDTFGWILFQRREYAWAATVLSESAAKLATNPEVQYHLGMTRYMLGDEAGARGPLAFAVGASADFVGKDKAAAYLAILDADAAAATDATLAQLRAHIQAVPNDPIAPTRLAGILARRGQADEAGRLLESVLKAHPESASALTNLAAFLLERPDTAARALELARQAYKIAPEDLAVVPVLGRAAYRNGDHTWSASLLREAARRAPGDARIQADFARASYAVGSVTDAVGAARAALAAEGTGPLATEMQELVELTELTASAPLPPGAADRANVVLARDAANVPALMLSAAALEARGDTAGAVALYEKALAALPRFTPAVKRLAVLLARRDPPDARAFDFATRAREALPNDAEVAAALGGIHFHRAEYPRAATLLGEAVRSPNASPETHYMLGIAQRQLGDTVRSRASLQRALDLGLSGEAAEKARAAMGD